MLATTGSMPSRQEGWAFEIKWDGVRAVCYVEGGRLHMESRNLLDITPRYPELHGLGPALGGRDAVLDGEVVTFDPQGRPSFGLLQQRMHLADERMVRRLMVDVPVALMVFDLLWLDGRSLTGSPWQERRAALEELGEGWGDGPWRMSTAWPGEGASLLAATRQRGLEGVIAKKADSLYEPGRRSKCWIKIKNVNRQEFVVGGWLPGSGNREGRLGALIVGYYDGDDLRPAGKVGTGFTDRDLEDMARRLEPLARDTSPFAEKVPWREARFVEPVLVGDVEFTEWTAANTLRHPSWKGLRTDKSPREVVREPLSGRQ
ncbi:MAG TPA: non-homologous end-joining DNA ligase [Acidimicrobiales bacterium]|jgi:bifunctional non-homologous end joining protein LigD|nr:non-homologous end-joining DNA ligase [Acidimicrobiales bacterium]